MPLPLTLPKEPKGFTRRMAIHLNLVGGRARGTFEVFAPDGTKLPIVYAYTTGRGSRTVSQGFYLPGTDEPMTWEKLAAIWPQYMKLLARLQATGASESAAISRAGEPLTMTVIYDRPRDYPDGYLARSWSAVGGIIAPGKLLGTNLPSIEAARELVPKGLINIGRNPLDDDKIVEVWI